uniref:Uncharacterized protein n=1 Tax=Romanomermis culicivorax TaxID=13658 RepID=A0A915KA09_ROMCU
MLTLRQNVMDVLQNCDRPKYEIMLKGCYKLLCGGGIARQADSVGASRFENTLVQLEDSSPLLSPRRKKIRSYTDETSCGRVQLFCPGRIMHLQMNNPYLNETFPVYNARWVHQTYFSDVRISNSMIMDHMPWVLSNVLKSYIKQQTPDNQML